MKNLLSLKSLGRDGVERILSRTREIESYAREKKLYPLVTKIDSVTPLVMGLFLERSLRTWGSFATAAQYLGCNFRALLGMEQTSMAKGETFANTIRMLACQQGADILTMRTTWEGAPRFAAEILQQHGCQVPVINGGDGCNRHPSQALLDLATINQRLGRLTDFTIGLVGDLKHSRVAHDLLEAARLFGFRVGILCAAEARPAKEWLAGVDVVFASDDFGDLGVCDVLYLFRLQKERIADPLELQRAILSAQITPAVLDKYCKPDVLVMHAQPIDQEGDLLKLFPGVFQDPRIIVHHQAAMGLPTRMAILAECWKGRGEAVELPTNIDLQPIHLRPAVSIDQYLADRSAKREEIYRPIQNGTLIDHLPPGEGLILWALLERLNITDKKKPVFLAANAGPSRLPGGVKDVLILKQQFLPYPVLAVINFLVPEATINIFSAGQFSKIRLPMPKLVPAMLPCPNPDCITNHDPEAQSRFWSVGNDQRGFDLQCDYCERVFSREEIFPRP